MSWSFAENVLHLEFDALWTTAVALLLLILGYGLRRKLRFFETFCIPAPVIGGLIMAIVALILHHNGGATIKFTTALQSPMMLAFFTTVGIGGSLALIAKGGKALVIYLVFCWALAVIQNGVGAGLAKASAPDLPRLSAFTPCSASWPEPSRLKAVTVRPRPSAARPKRSASSAPRPSPSLPPRSA